MWNNSKLFIGGTLGVLVLMFLATHPDTEQAARTDAQAPAPVATFPSTPASTTKPAPAGTQSQLVQTPQPPQPSIRPSIRGEDEYEDD